MWGLQPKITVLNHLLTAGCEDDWPLGGSHEGLDGRQEPRVLIKDNVHLLEEDERGGRLLVLLFAAAR